jgi:lysophospholipid acyltransferase (LPLAT)-like uncharacterized protein
MNGMKNIISELKWRLIGISGKLLIDAIFLTSRIEVMGRGLVEDVMKSQKYILVFWHSRLLLPSYMLKNINCLVLVSQSRDGEIIRRIINSQGQEAVRGSSTRGGLRALAGMIRNLKENQRPGGFSPDGPQGPRFKVKPGVITCAKKTGFPIVPVTYSASRIKVFSSWDRFILPLPFSRCTMAYGEPLYVPSDADESREKECLERLEEELNRLTRQLDRHYHHNID